MRDTDNLPPSSIYPSKTHRSINSPQPWKLFDPRGRSEAWPPHPCASCWEPYQHFPLPTNTLEVIGIVDVAKHQCLSRFHELRQIGAHKISPCPYSRRLRVLLPAPIAPCLSLQHHLTTTVKSASDSRRSRPGTYTMYMSLRCRKERADSNAPAAAQYYNLKQKFILVISYFYLPFDKEQHCSF